MFIFRDNKIIKRNYVSDRECHAFKCLVPFVNRSLLFNNFGDVNSVHCTVCIQWTKLLENAPTIFSIPVVDANVKLEECQELCVNMIECTGVGFDDEGCYLAGAWYNGSYSRRGLTYYHLDRECTATTPHSSKRCLICLLLYAINVKKT